MTLTVWRNLLNRLILLIEFTALFTLLIGTEVRGHTHELPFVGNLFQRYDPQPTPLIIEDCEEKDHLNPVTIKQFSGKNESCSQRQELQTKKAKRYSYWER